MKNLKLPNCILLMISVLFTILFVFSNSATASTVEVLKGNDAIKDANNSIVYYKSGVVSNSTGTVNLIKKDQKTGVKKVLTKVDGKPFYLQDNYIYYTTSKGIYGIKTDGTNKKQIFSLIAEMTRFQILGLNGNYIYYSYFIDNEEIVIGRIHVDGTNHKILRKLTEAETYSFHAPVLTNNMIYYVGRTSDNKLSLTSTTLDGKTTKNVIKAPKNISEMKGNRNGLYFIYQKESTSDSIIQKIDSSGIITNLVTLEYDFPHTNNIKLSCFEDDFLYYTVGTKIYQVKYDGKEHQLLYDASNLNKDSTDIAEIFIKGDWMIIKMDEDVGGAYNTYCVKKDGSYQIYLGYRCYSNSFDILSNTIYYRVETIPGDGEYSYNNENIYRKFTLPLKEYK